MLHYTYSNWNWNSNWLPNYIQQNQTDCLFCCTAKRNETDSSIQQESIDGSDPIQPFFINSFKYKYIVCNEEKTKWLLILWIGQKGKHNGDLVVSLAFILYSVSSRRSFYIHSIRPQSQFTYLFYYVMLVGWWYLITLY